MNLTKIIRAIISVSDKSNLNIILPTLKKFKIEILSSGGSFKKIKSMGYACIDVSNYTEYPEMLNGRVKTLHPKIHAGILSIRKNTKHIKDLKKKKISNIDLVIVDLYPFEKQLNTKLKFRNLVKYIDIGGSALIRSAAKNFDDVTVISDIDDYNLLTKELKVNKGKTSIQFRKFMASKAFNLTAYYDSTIANRLNDELNIKFSERKTIYGKLVKKLRYGENPHQNASLYKTNNNLGLEKLHGKALSYNNYNDIYAALSVTKSLKLSSGVAIIKHANPCGVSIENNPVKSFRNALACDPASAFGGVVAINSIISKQLAIELNKTYFEVIISKGFKKDALNILKKRKNIRLINFSKFNSPEKENYLFLGNFFLAQESNSMLIKKKLSIVTKKKPTVAQLNSLTFALNVCKFVKSNAIVLANNNSTIGIGSGQPSRLGSCKIASDNAFHFVPEKLSNSVAASDAFFPFADGIKKLIESGVKAIIQPGGSVNDKDVIKAADDANITMVFTGLRHFRH